jgi:hypothetical protein
VVYQAPPVGFVEVTTASPPTATHSDTDGHDSEARGPALPAAFHSLAPPVGFEVTTVPFLPTATQSDVDGHDTACNLLPRSTDAVLHALEPPVGFVEVTTFPRPSTATHSPVVGHDTPSKSPGFS